MDKKKIGEIAEKAVERAMIMKGYQFLTRNYSIHNIGELDIVFLSKHEVVIVEVRSRRESHYYPSPLDSVDRRKQNKIYRTTKYLIDRYNLYDKNISFLVGCVTLTDDYLIQNVELIPFQWNLIVRLLQITYNNFWNRAQFRDNCNSKNYKSHFAWRKYEIIYWNVSSST